MGRQIIRGSKGPQNADQGLPAPPPPPPPPQRHATGLNINLSYVHIKTIFRSVIFCMGVYVCCVHVHTGRCVCTIYIFLVGRGVLTYHPLMCHKHTTQKTLCRI